ncbi:MAG: penicillin acylase family protein [Caldilineales bacterium]
MARRILLIVLAVLVVALVLLAGAVGYVTLSPLPKTNGTITAPGLQGAVTIYRDEWGVPQIYAGNSHDLFFAQGYVHAQDRLFQLDFQRRVGLGRLSEVLGEATLDTDRFLRTLGTNRAAQQDLEHLAPETLAALQAYSDGVNAYINQHSGNLPLEFRILGYQPEHWQPLDSVAWAKVMSYNLASNWETELMRAQLIDAVGEDATADLLPAYPAAGPYVIPPEVKSYSGLDGLSYGDATALRRLLKADAGDTGSNNWVVAGSHTTSGMPLLANDPHLGLQMPSVFYEVGLHGGGYDVAGLGLPGTPGVLIGHNGRVAWGMTTIYSDQQDLFIEKQNPDNPNQVEYQGNWEDVQVVEESIPVKGREAVVETVRITRHGPIMNAVVGDLEGKADPVALRWTALDEDHLVDSLLLANRAGSVDEFRAALRQWDSGSQNFVIADTQGNIAMQGTGRTPIRAAGDGRLPVPGWTGEYEWTGTIPYEQMPFAVNPEIGYLASANNSVVPADYPYLFGTDYAAPFRAQRITDLLAGKDKLSIDDIAAMQADVHPLPTDAIVPLLDGVTLDGAAQTALDMLRAWDRTMDADRAEPLIYEQFFQELARSTLGDELAAAGGQELVDSYLDGFGNSYAQAMVTLAGQPEDTWWDDVSTPAVETQADIVPAAFGRAVAALQAGFGDDPARWRYGDPHYANFDHLVFGGVAPLDSLFNRSTPARGDAFTVDAAKAAYQTMQMDHGASMREIIDLGNLLNSRIVNTTGQSGQLLSRHYGDMIDLWQSVGYHPLRFDRTDIEQSAADVLTLQP